MSEVNEKKPSFWERTRKYHTCFVVGITLLIGFVLCVLLVYAIKTSGPSVAEIVYGDWSECREDKTRKRNIECSRQYCLTYVEPCVYQNATWSEWSLCSNQSGPGYQTRRWLCNDETDCEVKREKQACSSNDLAHLCQDGSYDIRVGDGYCDDIFNWHVCNFDGGDCCETNTTRVNRLFCQDCFCLENYIVKDSCYYKDRIGNGICDDLANTQECSYDGGDCCLFNETAYETCTECACLYDPVEIMSSAQYFPIDKCLHKFTGAFNDGFCHDELNTEECEYDGGDCCLPNVYTDACQECQCKDPSIKGIIKSEKGCGLLTKEELVDVKYCKDYLNVPECQYSNGQCCGEAVLHFCDECKCKDPRNTEMRNIEKCEYYVSKGDGFCDDVNNIPECDYDGGDCCGSNVQHGLCQRCECLDEAEKQYENTPQWTCQKEKMFNGICDPTNKESGCHFDGFDCALPPNCPLELLSNQVCDAEVNGTECYRDLGLCDGGWFGNQYLCLEEPKVKGDGLCDLLNNFQECNFDSGDCSPDRQVDTALIVAVGRVTSTINDVGVIFTNSSQGSALPRAPLKVDDALAFNHNGTMWLCGGRMKSGFILSSCSSLDYKKAIGISDQYLLWQYKQTMPITILFAAVELLDLNGRMYAWVTGGEGTNARRVSVIGAVETTFLYDLELNQWQSSTDLPLALAGHCMIKILEDKVLFAGGYKDNGQLSRNAYSIQIPDGQMSSNNFQTRGPLREARKFMACDRFVEKTGRLVPVIVGGVDAFGTTLTSAEIFYDSNGEWNFIGSLPSSLGYGTANVINNRLVYVGGAQGIGASDDLYIYNEETGWHLTNMNLITGRFRHVSVLIDANDVGATYPETPNIFIGFGKTATGASPESEVICMSQLPDHFDAYCNRDGALDLVLDLFGSIIIPYKGDIYACGGLFEGQVSKDCYYINPNQANWLLSDTLTLQEARMFPAITLSIQGDWVISGGYSEEPSESSHITSKTVEVINERVQRQEKDMATNLAQHCMVHIYCYYYLYVGGTAGVSNVAIPAAYYHHVKSGNFHKLPSMKQARANHVCFVEPGPKGGQHRRVFVVGGRYWTQVEGILRENILTSSEIFDTETETWSPGPELPYGVAFASAVSTPFGTFVLGGQTVGDSPTSVTAQILRLTTTYGSDGSMQGAWEILPYQLATPRRSLAAISLNTDNFRHTSEENCNVDFKFKASKTFYRFSPENISPRIMVVLENQKVKDFDVSGDVLKESGLETVDWPTDIKYALGGYMSNFLVIVGGISTKAANARYQGETGSANHAFASMLYGHFGGAGGQIEGKFVAVGGKDLDGILHGKSEYFDGGKWYEIMDTTLTDYKISGSCLAGSKDLPMGFLIGGEFDGTKTVPYVWKLDFSVTPLKWTRAASLTNQRQRHSCGLIKVGQKYYAVAAGGITDKYYTRDHLVIPSVEVYDIELDIWRFTSPMPIPLYGGSVAVVQNRIFYFGGTDIFRQNSDVAFEYIPKPSGQEYANDKTLNINSYWKEYSDLGLGQNDFMIAIGYEL